MMRERTPLVTVRVVAIPLVTTPLVTIHSGAHYWQHAARMVAHGAEGLRVCGGCDTGVHMVRYHGTRG